MQDYYYTLVRYVPDVQRMEPINVGVILQGRGQLDIRFSPHAAKRKEIDTGVFQQWRQFLLEEVQGKPAPLFQPPKTSPKFLDYLGQLCDGAVLLSQPLLVSVDESRPFADMLAYLYQRLVAPSQVIAPAEAARPSGRFRQLTISYSFLRRGMRKHAPIKLDQEKHWMAYRQVVNGSVWAIDKIEVGNQIGTTASEIQAMNSITLLLKDFLAGRGLDRPTKYYFLADALESPFTDQAADEFSMMRDDLESVVRRVRDTGGTVIRTASEAELLANELDQALPPLTVAQSEIAD